MCRTINKYLEIYLILAIVRNYINACGNIKSDLFKIHLPFTNNAYGRNTRIMGVIMRMMVYKKQPALSSLLHTTEVYCI
jgi:hypothetical protein